MSHFAASKEAGFHENREPPVRRRLRGGFAAWLFFGGSDRLCMDQSMRSLPGRFQGHLSAHEARSTEGNAREHSDVGPKPAATRRYRMSRTTYDGRGRHRVGRGPFDATGDVTWRQLPIQ